MQLPLRYGGVSSDCRIVQRCDRTRDVREVVQTGCIAFGQVFCQIEQIMTIILSALSFKTLHLVHDTDYLDLAEDITVSSRNRSRKLTVLEHNLLNSSVPNILF
jgi:hypothetical protein